MFFIFLIFYFLFQFLPSIFIIRIKDRKKYGIMLPEAIDLNKDSFLGGENHYGTDLFRENGFTL